MDDLNIIDQFTQTFVAYIDSGFGLLGPNIAFLTTILIGIDITLAGLFWAMSDDKSVIPAFIKKVLYVGAFAFIINNFQFLSTVIFESFAGLGLQATATGLTINDLMRPGFVAATGYDASLPILEEVNELIGPIAFFENFVTIAVLMFAWAFVIIAFFILAVQLFITIIEFKLTTLAGFVLVPFALWNKTAFLSEKVLGNVVSSGVKLMVLAVIVGIGSTLFSSFTASFSGPDITLEQALSTVLGALCLLMLGIFGPGVAAGLITGAPQLGAGAAAGTALGAGLATVAGGGMAVTGGRMAVSGGRMSAAGVGGAVKAGASVAGGAHTAFQLGIHGTGSPMSRISGGISSVAQTATKAGGEALRSGLSGVTKPIDNARASIGKAYSSGVDKAFAVRRSQPSAATAAAASMPETTMSAATNAAPAWAQRLQASQRQQTLREGATATAHAVKDGDRGGAGDSPRLEDDER